MFRVASILVDGDLDPDHPTRFDHPEVVQMASRLHVTFVIGCPIRYAEIVITTAEGQTLRAAGDDHTFDHASWRPWLAAPGHDLLPSGQLVRAVALIEELETVEDISELMVSLRRSGQPA